LLTSVVADQVQYTLGDGHDVAELEVVGNDTLFDGSGIVVRPEVLRTETDELLVGLLAGLLVGGGTGDESVVVVVGATVDGVDVGAAVRAGTQTDPPHTSPMPQHAETPLNTHCGWAAWHVTEQSPTPLL